MLGYGVSSANMARDDMLSAVLIASAIMVPIQFVFSSYSDKHGEKVFYAWCDFVWYLGFAIFPLVIPETTG